MGDEAPNWEMRSDGPERLGGKKTLKQSGLLPFEARHVFFEPLKFTLWMRKGRKLKIVHAFTQSRTSLYLGGFNTIYHLFNHPVAAHRDGHHGMSTVGTG